MTDKDKEAKAKAENREKQEKYYSRLQSLNLVKYPVIIPPELKPEFRELARQARIKHGKPLPEDPTID